MTSEELNDTSFVNNDEPEFLEEDLHDEWIRSGPSTLVREMLI